MNRIEDAMEHIRSPFFCILLANRNSNKKKNELNKYFRILALKLELVKIKMSRAYLQSVI